MKSMSAGHKVLDLIDVPLAYILSISLLQIKDWLGITAMCITILYTSWKWVGEYREKYYSKNKKTKK